MHLTNVLQKKTRQEYKKSINYYLPSRFFLYILFNLNCENECPITDLKNLQGIIAEEHKVINPIVKLGLRKIPTLKSIKDGQNSKWTLLYYPFKLSI